MTRHIDRRRFLELAAALPFAPSARAAGSGRIVVVGAGLAGLRAAGRLKEAGLDVLVLEARTYPGGRVRTIRDPFDEGLYAEAGAIRFSGAHRRVLAAARALGLTLVPLAPASGASLMAIGGKRLRSTDPPARAFADFPLHAGERGLDPAALLAKYAGGAPPELARPDAGPADYQRWRALDAVSWPDWLRAQGASAAAIALMTLGGDASELSALYLLRQIALHSGASRYFKIKGGMELLPQTMGARLKAMIRYGAPVYGIDAGAEGARIFYLDGGTPRSIVADRVVLAVPFSTLRAIRIDAPFSPGKRAAIEQLAYFPGSRFLLQAATRFWRDERLSGFARTDQPAEIWDCTYDCDGEAGVLGVTAGGEAGRKALGMTPAECLDYGVGLAAATFPEIRKRFQRGVSYRWAEQRWSRGAFATFAPGQMTALAPDIARPEGLFHFAGEHTSPWTGWMEGALESGDRVASEILAARQASP